MNQIARQIWFIDAAISLSHANLVHRQDQLNIPRLLQKGNSRLPNQLILMAVIKAKNLKGLNQKKLFI